MTIYIDLDGVLADFEGKIRSTVGVSNYLEDPVKVWKTFEGIPNLFQDLDIISGAKSFIDTVTDAPFSWQGVEILTACPQLTGMLVTAQKDKVLWVRKHISWDIQVNVVPHWSKKKFFCSPFVRHHSYSRPDILIDDQQRNIDDWISMGGIGILHTSFENSLQKLKDAVL